MSQVSSKRIQITNQLYPAYYTQFSCIADRCQNNCCYGWNISFGKKDYLKIKRAPKSDDLEKLTGQAMRRLPDGQRTEERYGEFAAQKGPCPYQNENGLCRLQMECGEGILPKVCKEFPRIHAYTPMGWEKNLSTACEAVVELLWELPQGIDFIEEPLPKEQWRSCSDDFWNRCFISMRGTVIDILQARQFPLAERLIILGIALENAKNTWEKFDLNHWQRRVQLLLSDTSLTQTLKQFPGDLTKFVAQNTRIALMMEESEIFIKEETKKIKASWHIVPKEQGLEVSMEYDESHYKECKTSFQNYFGDIEYFFENILVNTAFWQRVPNVSSPQEMWKGYVVLCGIYSYFRFISVLFCGKNPTKEKLMQAIVVASRGLLHNTNRRSSLGEQFFDTHNDTLAHMAILVKE